MATTHEHLLARYHEARSKPTFEHKRLKKEGALANLSHRQRAIRSLRQGNCVYIVTGNKDYGVGGIFFNIDSLRAVDKVIRTKSWELKSRQALFGVMTPDDYFHQISNTRYSIDLIESPPVFVRTPVKQPHNFPEWAVNQATGLPIVQCFLSDHVPHFGEFIREALAAGIRVGGTSLNLSGQGNITQLEMALAFFHTRSSNPDIWLHTDHPFTGVSHTIIELSSHSPRARLHRQGGIDFSAICTKLGLQPLEEE